MFMFLLFSESQISGLGTYWSTPDISRPSVAVGSESEVRMHGLLARAPVWRKICSFMEIDHEIISTVILPILLIQKR